MQINAKAALLLLVALLMSGCSKITYEADCAPKLTYRFPDSALFAVMDIDKEPIADKMQAIGLASRVGFNRESYDKYPEEFSIVKVMSNSVHMMLFLPAASVLLIK